MGDSKTIWTIGHSTRTQEEFIQLLKNAGIKNLADVRTYPGSKRFPHFNSEVLQNALAGEGIHYFHYKDLGGRKKPRPGSANTAWRSEAFQGYADHMETAEFMISIQKLEEMATIENTVYMCSEAVWWRCHRALISDYLKVRNWHVFHIMEGGKITEHPYTSAATVVQGNLFYGVS
ncbi:MAG TPA: DUF488 domain-containing protein [Flavitalea sp.]|nr:DUF488 domain-containing protein [Flavitalea sp.]